MNKANIYFTNSEGVSNNEQLQQATDSYLFQFEGENCR